MESEENLFSRLLCGSTDGEEVSKVSLHVSLLAEADERLRNEVMAFTGNKNKTHFQGEGT